jgi:ubiquinone/menaquinone biosynthesis C-methylase UbiE
MAATKATLVARRVEFIEAAVEKLEFELESAEGLHRETLLRLFSAVHEALRMQGRHTCTKPN